MHTGATLGIVALLAWLLLRQVRRMKRLPSPPGPPQLPLVGNGLNNPILAQMPWKEYAALAQKYGDVMYFNVFGQPILVLSSTQAIVDLFDKRSTIYSSKPSTPMLHDLMGLDWVLTSMPYGDRWRRTRRLIHQNFYGGIASKYHHMQMRDSRNFIQRLRETPEQLLNHIRVSFATSTMKLLYDIDIKDENDPYVHLAEKAIAHGSTAALPGRFLVDAIPLLKYVPEWFPGASFQTFAKRARTYFEQSRDGPFKYVKDSMSAGTAGPSVTSSMLERTAGSSDQQQAETTCRDAACILYFAGADTTMSSLQSLFLALLLHPEVQRKAQAELDRVVGRDRLPTFEDRPSLPYIDAIVKECLRWHLVLPLALPHLTSEDDVYRGWYIPKGTLVFGNSWAILHDPAVYSDPEQFVPERFLTADGQLDPNVQDPDIACFGYGRRICPGRYFARNSLFIQAASVLHVFNVSPALNEDGTPVHTEYSQTSKFISYPTPYKCTIKTRGAFADSLVDGIHSAE